MKRFLVRFPVLALLTFSCSTPATPATTDAGADAAPVASGLGMNDVSVLFPLPASPATPATEGWYLGPASQGARGPLLTQAIYDKIPKFPVQPSQGLDFARMRVVAARFDGCFPGKAGCEAQIRLVLQPISDAGAALDSAIHVFYTLTEAELPEVVLALRKLRGLAPELADGILDVNPALVAQGPDGAYGRGLRELILRFAGEQNLSRMTFFVRAPPRQEEWFFGGFDRVEGNLVQLNILGVGKANQRVDRPIVADGYQYVFTPAASAPEDLGVLMSSATAKAASPAELDAALGAAARLMNPTKYGPDQLPCAGCHVAPFVSDYARRELGKNPASLADTYTSPSKLDLTVRGESGVTPSSLRAFGYFGTKPMITPRVVNESAEVVADLQKRFPAR